MASELLACRLIRDIPDFPHKGIIFKDITPVLQNHQAFSEVIDRLSDFAESVTPDIIVGIESRGFILGAPMALKLGKGFVPVRKIGKLPHKTVKCEYALEYGTSAVEMHRDAVLPGQRVLIVDDLLATGGTSAASVTLVEELGGVVAGIAFMIELEFLDGRTALEGYKVESLIKY
ncbi:MAG: adenine phosphoribosyltransferase [Armatimonadota bacterium]